MVKSITIYLLIILTVGAFTFVNPASSDDNGKTELFTKDEAKVLRYNDDEQQNEGLPTNSPDTLGDLSSHCDDPKVTNTDKVPTIVVIEPTSVLITIKQNDSPLDPGT